MDQLDDHVKAYDEVYLLDNELTLKWSPGRVLHYAKGDSMLELGLGHAYNTAVFSQRFARYAVIEGSVEIIRRFHDKYPDIKADIIQGYFETVNIDERFDNIGMGFILEHVDDPVLILNKYKRNLAAGGSVFISVPNGEALHRRIGYEAGLLKDMMALSESDFRFGHRRVFHLNSLKELVQSQGFMIKNVEGLFLKPLTTRQIIDLKLDDHILQAMMKVGMDYPELCNSILMEITLCE